MNAPTTEVLVDARDLDPPEPFERAMMAVDLLQPGQHILLLLHREPYPLYSLLDNMGWQHETRFVMPAGHFEIRITQPAA